LGQAQGDEARHEESDAGLELTAAAIAGTVAVPVIRAIASV
jgi:hypothetical protein